jgi:hypothetical protein
MAIANDQPPKNPTAPAKHDDGSSSSPITDSFATIFPLVLGGAFIIGLILAFLILWLTRRRRRNKAAVTPETKQKDNEAALIDSRSSHDTNNGGGGKSSWLGSTTRRKLQKACSVGGAGPGVWSKVGVCGGESDDGEGRGWPRRHMSMPLIPRPCSKGHFHFVD